MKTNNVFLKKINRYWGYNIKLTQYIFTQPNI